MGGVSFGGLLGGMTVLFNRSYDRIRVYFGLRLPGFLEVGGAIVLSYTKYMPVDMTASYHFKVVSRDVLRRCTTTPFQVLPHRCGTVSLIS